MARTTSFWCRKIGTNEWIFFATQLWFRAELPSCIQNLWKNEPYLNFKHFSWICVEQLNCYMHSIYLFFHNHREWIQNPKKCCDLIDKFDWSVPLWSFVKMISIFPSKNALSPTKFYSSKLPTKHRNFVHPLSIRMNHSGDRNPCGDFRCFPFLFL